MSSSEDPDHSIIFRPWEYQITAFSYQQGDEWSESYIDMVLQKNNCVRRLRFYSPQEIEIQKGFPAPTNGMYIADVSARKLERLRVRVGDFEASHGKVRFWARDVVDLDQAQND